MPDWPTKRRKFKDHKEMVSYATKLAARYHAGQFDRDGYPHLYHCVRVAGEMDTLALQALALLHDIPEDCTRHNSNSMITIITITDNYIWPDWMRPSLDAITRRKGEEYADYIERVSMDESARIVKIADIEDNLNRKVPPTDVHKVRYQKALEFLRSIPSLV